MGRKTRRRNSERSGHPHPGVFLAIVAALSFVSGLPNGFTFDDEVVIESGPAAVGLGALGRILTTPNWIVEDGGNLFRPLTLSTFALQRSLGFEAPGMRLLNILLFMGLCWLVYQLALVLFERAGVALAAGLLFAVHPIHTEAVTSLVGRAELLSGCGVLGATLLVLRASAGRPAGVWPGVILFLGLLSKESAVAGLGVVLVAAWISFQREQKLLSVEVISCAVAVAALFVVRWAVLGSPVGGDVGTPVTILDNPLAHASASERILTALWVQAKYVGLLLVPWALSADYSFDSIQLVSSLGDLRAVFGALFVVGFGLSSLYALLKRSPMAVLAALYVGPMLIVGNLLFPIGTIMAERLLLVPSVGFSIAAAVVAVRVGETIPKRQARVAAAAVLLLLCVRTNVRNLDWKDAETLYAATLEAQPRSAKMLHNLGNARRRAKDWEQSIKLLQQALDIYPDYDSALHNLGLALQGAKRHREAEATYRKLLRLRPTHWPSKLHLALYHQERSEFAEMERLSREAVDNAGEEELDPPRILATALLFQGRTERALEILEVSREKEPRNPEVYEKLAFGYAKAGEPAKAVEAYEELFRLAPSHPRIAVYKKEAQRLRSLAPR